MFQSRSKFVRRTPFEGPPRHFDVVRGNSKCIPKVLKRLTLVNVFSRHCERAVKLDGSVCLWGSFSFISLRQNQIGFRGRENGRMGSSDCL